jgi:hypothetical protein
MSSKKFNPTEAAATALATTDLSKFKKEVLAWGINSEAAIAAQTTINKLHRRFVDFMGLPAGAVVAKAESYKGAKDDAPALSALEIALIAQAQFAWITDHCSKKEGMPRACRCGLSATSFKDIRGRMDKNILNKDTGNVRLRIKAIVDEPEVIEAPTQLPDPPAEILLDVAA